ncbi:MAG: hypothetical protein R2707_10785 [Acidimicrobiales bacterium]
MAKRMRTVLFSAVVVALVATSCGGGDGESNEVSDPTTATAVTTSVPTTSTTSSSSTTTEPPSPTGPTPLPLDEIPDLVVAWGDGTGDPLELALAIIGFPLAIPTPENTTPLRVSVDMVPGSDERSPWTWDWSYEVLSADPMPDIDIQADEPSPGNVALREFYDPIMTDLGWTYSNSTGSDPSSGAGGPQSINHVYQSGAATIVVNGLPATPKPIFVWADEEQVYGEGIPGYQVDVPFEFEPGVIPVPFIQTIVDELPEIDGAQLTDVRLQSWNRSEDSFDADRGLRYLEVTIELTLAPDAVDDAKATFAGDLGTSAFFAGEESFFEPGFVEPAEPREFGDDWTQPVVFLDRYEGSIVVSVQDSAEDDRAGATATVKVTFEPNRPVLEELSD